MAKKTSESCAKDIFSDFAELPDPRLQVNRRHLLGDIIVISIMAVLAGADGPKAIGVWAKSLEHRLKDRLQLPSGVPSHDTIGRVLMMLTPAAFQSCFSLYQTSLRQSTRDFGPLFLVSACGGQFGVAQTIRDRPTEASRQQRRHRDATPSDRLESKLSDASPWNFNNLVYVSPGGESESCRP